MHTALRILFILCFSMSWTNAQYIFNGFYLTEKNTPPVSQVLAVAGNSTEKYFIGVSLFTGKVAYFRSVGSGEFQEFFPRLKGFLYQGGTSSFAITNEKIAFDRDAVYFSTLGAESGSYRLVNGVSQEILATGSANVRSLTGSIQNLNITFVGTASPVAGKGYVFQVTVENDKAKYILVKEVDGSYTTLLQLPNAELLPYGVWTPDGVRFQFVELEKRVYYFSEYNALTKKITRYLSSEDLVDGENWDTYRVTKSETGERYVSLTLKSGKVKIVKFPTKTQLEEVYAVPATINGFTVASAEFPAISNQALFVPVANEKVPTANTVKGVFSSSKQDSLLVQSKVTILPNGKKVTGIESRMIFVSGCAVNMPLFVDGFANPVLYEAKTPCLLEPLSGVESSSIKVKGSGFQLGNPLRVEARVGTLGFSLAKVDSDTDLTFLAPPLLRCSKCKVSVVLYYKDGTSIESNSQELSLSPVPVAKPQIAGLTDLYGKSGAAPGKAMTLWGSHFCSLSFNPPLLEESSVPLKTDSAVGCRVLVDGKPVGLYFAYTGTTGDSQINLLLPYTLAKGNHTVSVEKLENQDGKIVVVGTSESFSFSSEDSSPTFFKLIDGSLTVQNASQQYSIVLPSNPAKPGDYLVIYLSGGGKTINVIPDRGALASAYTLPAKVIVGGEEVPVLYAGTQGQFPGIEQINFQLPENGSAGTIEIKVTVGGIEQSFTFSVTQ